MRDAKNRDRIRFLLLHSENGLTVNELTEQVGTTKDNIRKILAKLYGCYIDHWVSSGIASKQGGSLSAVWKCVEVPAHAPDPSGRVESLKSTAKMRIVGRPLDKRKRTPLPKPSGDSSPTTTGLTRWASPPPWAQARD
jgi:hypothetical protein